MTRKERIEASINDMIQFGETFIGTIEVQGMAVVKYYKALNREVQKMDRNKVVCWDAHTGMAWIA